MSDCTSSEGSYSYESESQHWEFGDDDLLDADDGQVEENHQLFSPHGDSSVAGSPRTVQDAHQLVTTEEQLTESDPRLQDGNSGDEGRARGAEVVLDRMSTLLTLPSQQ
ncbi:hypothetical protein PF005_g2983 [Phytophthora fragariae]|uniref:Uncharacterized protein n=1 Tax=Phytophthora fragariae TaxID=53985 RepID=A0A6A3M733_9STRA|nr:hypothetical protein PF003_g14445 [Phytophthora fragariae]KAE8946876.1 hypothetical protein PF009_g3502 [Phytophthora fragariae]KAE9026208.1 hypothetical protein PF011_g2674 [Phytophthora fragariae]KAE9133950.1 hypothetical protein PF010_g2644 [Phytophthora fragariae]KAE9134295.1 hypothetical protein PF007_g3005 [Phytophthora fragariae]